MVWLVAVLIVLHQAWLYQRQKVFDPLSVYVMLDAAVMLILVIGTLTSPFARELAATDLGFAALLPIGQIALYVGLHTVGPKLKQASKPWSAPSLFWLYLSAAIYLLIAFFIAFSFMRLADISLMDWLFDSRIAAYSLARGSGVGSILNNVFTAAQVGVLILLAVALNQKRFGVALVVYGILIFGMFLIFTTRLQLLIIMVLPIVYFHYYVRRIGVLSFAGIAVAFLGIAAFLNLWRGGGLDLATGELSTENVVELSSISKGSYLIEPVGELYVRLRDGRLEYEYGANYGYALLTVVPRALWKDKPLTAFENRMTVRLFGSQLNEAGAATVWTFSAWGEGLAQFDLPGVALNLFLYGVVVALAFRYCSRRPQLFFVWTYYAILSAAYLRAGFQALFILTINMIVVAAIFEALPRMKIRWKAQRSLGSSEADG